MANSPILFLLIAVSWILGIFIVWFVYLFFKQTNIFILEKRKILIHLVLSFLTFIIIGAIVYMLAFIIAPDQEIDCSSSVCKIIKVNKLELSRNLGIVFGLITEFTVSSMLSMKLFTKKLENFNSEPE